MGNSLKVPSTKSTSPANSNIVSTHSNEFTNCYSHYTHNIPPPNAYSYYYRWPPYPPPHPPSQSTLQSSVPLPNTSYNNTKPSEPSIKEFLEELDKQYGEGRYTNFLQKFEEEEITVSQIAEMSPEILLNEFGIEITGRRLNLIKEAKKFI